MNAYLLTFDRNPLDYNYEEIHEKITAIPGLINWSHYLYSHYILVSNHRSSAAIMKDIHRAMGEHTFLVAKIDLAAVSGWMPAKSWEWVRTWRDFLNLLKEQKK